MDSGLAALRQSAMTGRYFTIGGDGATAGSAAANCVTGTSRLSAICCCNKVSGNSLIYWAFMAIPRQG
jgi:hypothetical protein